MDIRKISRFFLFAFVCFFSGLRDSLGSDYVTYTQNLLSNDFLEYGVEPAFSLFANIIYYSTLSPVFFFLITSIITNFFFFKSFYRYQYSFYIVLIYLLTPLFFYDTFNAVRQMFAASIFMYSCRYIESKDIIRYILFILVASTMHISALFLLPIYFIANRNINKWILLIILVSSFVFGTVIKLNIDELVSRIIPFYSVYTFRDTQHEGTGVLNVMFNLLLLVLTVRKHDITTSVRNTIAFNLFFIGVVFSNFTPSFYYISRLAMYFIIFGSIVIPMLLGVFVKYRQILQVILISVFVFLFVSFIVRYKDDKVFVPDKILSIFDLFDK